MMITLVMKLMMLATMLTISNGDDDHDNDDDADDVDNADDDDNDILRSRDVFQTFQIAN